MPKAEQHPVWNWTAKGLLWFLVGLAAAVIGYLSSYFWVTFDVGNVLSPNILKNQVISNQHFQDALDQLREQGVEFDENDAVNLSSDRSNLYKVSALNAYEPEEVKPEELMSAGYVRSKDGLVYYYDGKEWLLMIEE